MGIPRSFIVLLILASLASAQAGIPSGVNLDELMQKMYSHMSPDDLAKINGSVEALLANSTLVVMGSSLDGPENAIISSAEQAYPGLKNARTVPDNDEALPLIEGGSYPFVIVLGGPSQNRIAQRLLDTGALNQSEDLYGQGTVQYGKINGSLVAMVSDKRGTENAGRASVKFSPLAALGIPPEYVPAAATGISVIILALISLTRTVFEFKALDIGRKGKKVGQGSFFLFGINMSEIGAIMLASLVLGISISWQYFGPSPQFLFWVLVDSVICFVAGISHESTHRLFAWIFKVKVEYKIWPAGSALTLISSFLGNAFSIQGFILEEIPEGVEKWKVGLMKLAAPLLSNGVMLAFAFINVFYPNVIFQVVYSTSALWAMAEMLPFGALDGKDIKEWNFWIWLIAFVFVAACYIFVTFLL